MDSIPKFLASIITIMVAVLICVSFIISAVIVNSARTYHSSVIEEIEASDFNVGVIDKCLEAAESDNYILTVEQLSTVENEQNKLFKVTLGYYLSAPIFGNVIKGDVVGYAGAGGQLPASGS